MAVKWITSSCPGIRYYEHATRKGRNGQPDRYYAIRYRIGGQRKEEGIGWASEGWNVEKCQALLAEIKASIKIGKGAQSLAERRELAAKEREKAEKEKKKLAVTEMPLGEFLEQHYFPIIQTSKRTWKTDWQRICRDILPTFRNIPIKDCSTEMVQSFLNKLTERGLAPATVRHYMAILRHSFNIASQIKIEGVPIFAGQNPAHGIKLAVPHNARERYLQREEAERLIEAAANLRSPDLRDAIILCLNTGLRYGELIRMRWLDVDFPARFLTVPDEDKRKPGGKIPLNDTVIALLLERKELVKKSDLVFPPYAGGQYRANLSHMFGRLVNELGLNDGITDPRHKVVFHTLRHTFASWLALAGTDIYRIKSLMRHKTLTMTMRYAHLIPDATRDAVNRLDATNHRD